MRLAKPCLDIGLFTNDLEAHRAFWGETCGLKLDHVLPIRPGLTQHRFDAHGSVVKVNHMEEPLPARAPASIAGLTIARDGGPDWSGRDPAGDPVRLVRPGTDGITGIGIVLTAPDPESVLAFYASAFGFPREGADAVRAGTTRIQVVAGPAGDPTDDMSGPGFRYLTVQIFDADEAFAHVVAQGGAPTRAPVSLGTIARVAFVRDPAGTWIELSARASLTGIVPKPDPGPPPRLV
jgi:lactoylglutathione lyase